MIIENIIKLFYHSAQNSKHHHYYFCFFQHAAFLHHIVYDMSSIFSSFDFYFNLDSTAEAWMRARNRFDKNIIEKRFVTFNFEWSFQHLNVQLLMNAKFKSLSLKNVSYAIYCFICKMSVKQWQKNMNSYTKHLQISFNCEWLKKYHEKLMMIKKFFCKRCFVKFFSNIKLHVHIREKHNKKQKFFITFSVIIKSFFEFSASKSFAKISFSHTSIMFMIFT